MHYENLHSVGLNPMVQHLIPSIYRLLRFLFLNISFSENTVFIPKRTAHTVFQVNMLSTCSLAIIAFRLSGIISLV